MRLDELVAQLGGFEVVRGATETLEIGRVDVISEGLLPTEGSVYLCASAQLARHWLEENAPRSVRACLIAPRSIRKLDWPNSSMVVLAYKSEIIPLDLSARILRALLENEHPATVDHEVLCRGLLERIFEGGLELTDAVKKAASTLSMNLDSKHQVMLVILDTPEALLDNGRDLRSRLLSLVRTELLADSRFHEVHAQPSGAVGLLDCRAEHDSSHLPSAVSERLRRLSVPFAIGLGGAYHGPKYHSTALARSHREAREALEVRQHAGFRQAWISYEQARPLILTNLISRDPRVLELVQQALEPLLNTEPRYRRSLLEALHAYLEHRQSIQQAANELHIHPNTLKYRIQRLNDLLHLRDSSSAQRFLLLIAAKIVLRTTSSGSG